MNPVLTVEIQNSWQIDLVRIYRNRTEVKNYYFNLVLAEVFKASARRSNAQDLIVIFTDNHFCNVDNLDYKKLYQLLKTRFRTVSFASDCPYDYALDPEYFTMINSWGSSKVTWPWLHITVKSLQNDMVVNNDKPTKMFGLHILRPDVHRLGLLVALHRRGLLHHVDVRLGFRSQEFGNIEYRRSSNIDTVCFDFDITHRDLFDLIDSMPLGDRTNFGDNDIYKGEDLAWKDAEKNRLNKYFAVELICASSIHDHVLDFGEKVMRPLMLKQPFIYLGPAHNIAVFKKTGINVFDDIWDVSWDHYKEGWLPTKIDAISDICASIIAKYDIPTLQQMVKPGVEQNFDLMTNRFYQNRITSFPERAELFPQWLLTAPNEIVPPNEAQ